MFLFLFIGNLLKSKIWRTDKYALNWDEASNEPFSFLPIVDIRSDYYVAKPFLVLMIAK